MKIIKTLPKSEAFFNFFAPLIPTITLTWLLVQVVSFATEIGIVNSQLQEKLSLYLSPRYLVVVSIAISLLIACSIEIGKRQLLPLLVRIIANRKLTGNYLAMFVPIAFASLLLVASSGFLSFGGSKDMVTSFAPTRDTLNRSTFDNQFSKDSLEATNIYQQDSLSISQNYEAQIEAIVLQAKGKIELRREEIRQANANIKREYYINRNERAKAKASKQIKEIESEKASSIASLKSDQSKELASILSIKRNALATSIDDRTSKIQAQTTEIDNRFEEGKNKSNKYGNLLAWFTLVCLVIEILCIIIIEMFNKGSEIKQKAFVNNSFFEQGILKELSQALGSIFNGYAKKFIHWIESKAPTVEPNIRVNNLYDIQELKQARIKVKSTSLNIAAKDSQEEVKKIGFAYGIQENNENTANLDTEILTYAMRGLKSKRATYQANLRKGRGMDSTNKRNIEKLSNKINEIEAILINSSHQ